MTAPPRYLTKSRFKLALECPTKLHFTGRPDFVDASLNDSFLAALAEGGFQVGALACAIYPGGVAVDDRGHAEQLARTASLLELDEVTIYEAALAADGLFVRVDILRKRGDTIELIEVKAKSCDPARADGFRNRRGAIRPDILPYLQDIAFQRHVAGLALPGHAFRCFLMMADTSKVASVDGLNQRFRIVRDGGRTQVQTAPGTDAAALGDAVLTAIPVDDQVAQILGAPLQVGHWPAQPFEATVDALARAYREDDRIAPKLGAQCGSCQFRASRAPAAGQQRSGFHECWSTTFDVTPSDLDRGTVLDLWNFRGKSALIDRRVVLLDQLNATDIGFDGIDPGANGLTHTHRQWYQCRPEWPGGGEFYLATDLLRAERRRWRYPLHFIDFETAAVPIPFSRGSRPYQTLAFQFSHHVMHEDGRVEHRSQFLDARPGRHPNVGFLRALRNALGGDDGTVFRWATHENTVLNQLRAELLESAAPPDDADALIACVDALTTRSDGKTPHRGTRVMVDLCKLAERAFFHPASQGSSSLKQVLPALMRSSAHLRDTYGQPIYGSAAMTSLNLARPIAWWQAQAGVVRDPYRLLPPVFADLDPDDRALRGDIDDERLNDGGAAMAAYAWLQSGDLPAPQRRAIEAALLRYCELDTLAMVMAVQAWDAWLAERP